MACWQTIVPFRGWKSAGFRVLTMGVVSATTFGSAWCSLGSRIMGDSLHHETESNECQPGFVLVDNRALR